MHRTHWNASAKTSDTSEVTLKAAGGAGVFHYVTSVTLSNSDGSDDTEVVLGPGTSEGALTAGTGASDDAVGTVDWTDATNITASDNSDATITDGGAGSTSYYLMATNFGFDIPTDATIDGVVVEWEKQEANTTTVDDEIRILKAGAVVGDDKSVGANWAATDTFASYGGERDLWGTTWTPAEVNATGFGSALSATLAASDTANVDSCRITVYFSMKRFNLPNTTGDTHNFDPLRFGSNRAVSARAIVAAGDVTISASGYTLDLS